MSFYLNPYDSYREIDIPNDTNSITIHYGKHKDIINVILHIHIILCVQRGLQLIIIDRWGEKMMN